MPVGNYTNSQQAVRALRVLKANDQIGVHEWAEKCVSSKKALERIIAEFKACGLCHRSGWTMQPAKNFSPSSLYSFGPGEDAPRPRRPRAKSAHVETSALCQSILRLMSIGGTWTHRMAADFTKSPVNYVQKLMVDMRAGAPDKNLIHVVAWKRSRGAPVAVYELGPGPNKPKPRARSNAQILRDRRRRIIEEHGTDIARQIFRTRREGGSEKIISGGEVVYQRRV